AERESQATFNDTVRPLNASSARVRAMGNYFGQQNLGDAHRYIGSLTERSNQVGTAQAAVIQAQTNLGTAVTARGTLKTAPATATGADAQKAADALAKAEEQVVKMRAALDAANNDLEAINGKVKPFQSASEAISAAWQTWMDKSGANRGAFEQLADGLTHTLD